MSVRLSNPHLLLIVALCTFVATPSFAQNSLRTGSARGTQETASLQAGFSPDPTAYQLQSGGNVDINSERLAASGCRGFTSEAPNMVFNYTSAGRFLRFYVESQGDTTLVVRQPDGTWLCNDDAPTGGLNPEISIQSAQSGRYQIWLGSYRPGERYPAQLKVTEIPNNHPGSTAVWRAEDQQQQQQQQQVPHVRVSQQQPQQATGDAGFAFVGQVGNTPLIVGGNSIDEIYDACIEQLPAVQRPRQLRVAIGTDVYRGRWTTEQVCAIAALNSHPSPTVRGVAQGVPFSLGGSPAEIRRLLESFLTRAGLTRIRRATLDGSPVRGGPWSVSAFAARAVGQ